MERTYLKSCWRDRVMDKNLSDKTLRRNQTTYSVVGDVNTATCDSSPVSVLHDVHM